MYKYVNSLFVKVEMRNSKSEEWVQVGDSDGPKREYTQTGLTKGDKYSFRVRSVSKYFTVVTFMTTV